MDSTANKLPISFLLTDKEPKSLAWISMDAAMATVSSELGGNSTLQEETPLEAFLGGQHLFTPLLAIRGEKHVAHATQSQN